jgi:hypothetical protein
MDAGRRAERVGPEDPHHALEREVGILDLEQGLHRFARGARADHRRGVRLDEVGVVALVGDERDVAGHGFTDARHAADLGMRVTDHLAAQIGSQLLEGAGHGHGAVLLRTRAGRRAGVELLDDQRRDVE